MAADDRGTVAAEDPGKSWRAASGIPVVAAFDGFRALAIGGVVLFHILQVCGALTADSDSALGIALWGILPGGSLTMLFIVSGFVMYLPAAARGGDLGSVKVFAIRRAARLVPAYYVSLIVALLLLAIFDPIPGPAGDPGVGEVAAHFGLVQTPALLVDGQVVSEGVASGGFQLGLGVIPPVWTLSVEVGFYLVLPLVAAAYFRRPFVGLGVAALILAAWYAIAVNIGSIGDLLGVAIGLDDRGARRRLLREPTSDLGPRPGRRDDMCVALRDASRAGRPRAARSSGALGAAGVDPRPGRRLLCVRARSGDRCEPVRRALRPPAARPLDRSTRSRWRQR